VLQQEGFVLSGFILAYVCPSIDSWAAVRKLAVIRITPDRLPEAG
jgi:hypothetical protein